MTICRTALDQLVEGLQVAEPQAWRQLWYLCMLLESLVAQRVVQIGGEQRNGCEEDGVWHVSRIERKRGKRPQTRRVAQSLWRKL